MSQAPIQASIHAKDAVTAGKRYLSAWVPHQSGCSYAWEIVNGRILMGSKDTHVSFEAGAAGELELICTISNGSGKAVSKKNISVLKALDKPKLLLPDQIQGGEKDCIAQLDFEQENCTYQWKAVNATLTSATDAPSISFTAGPGGTLFLSCTLTNEAGESVTAWAVNSMLSPMVFPEMTAPKNLVEHREGYTAFIKNQPGYTPKWSISNGKILSGENSATVVFSTQDPGELVLCCEIKGSKNSYSSCWVLQVDAEPGLPKILGPEIIVAGDESCQAYLESAYSDVSYQWSISSGEILETGLGYVRFKAGPRPGMATLTCTARYPDGTVRHGKHYCPVEATLEEPEYTFFPSAPNDVLKSDTIYMAYLNANPGCTYEWAIENGELLSNPKGTFMKFKTGRYGHCRIICSSRTAHQAFITDYSYLLEFPAGIIFNLPGLPEGLAQATAVFGPKGFKGIALSGQNFHLQTLGPYEFVGQGLWYEHEGSFHLCEGSPYEDTFLYGDGLFHFNSPATLTKGLKIEDLELVEIRPTDFVMGSNGWKRPSSFTPAHRVQITQPFFISRFETTQALWASLMGSNPSATPQGDQLPVNNVSCEDIALFLEKLNAATHMTRPAGCAFRLPTEAEWEWATRGETRDALFAFGDTTERLPLYGHSIEAQGPQPVGRRYPNRFALHDTYGNVAEWVQDWFEPYSTECQTDPQGPKTGVDRIYRGGSWGMAPEMCNHFERGHAPDHRSDKIGFRLVLAETSSK